MIFFVNAYYKNLVYLPLLFLISGRISLAYNSILASTTTHITQRSLLYTGNTIYKTFELRLTWVLTLELIS